MRKPLVIQLKEAKANITESVNAARREGIPFYLLEPIVAELHNQVSNEVQKEYERALKQVAEAETKTETEKQPEEAEEKGADPE